MIVRSDRHHARPVPGINLAALLASVLFATPMVYLLARSVGLGGSAVGFGHYTAVLTDAAFGLALANSLAVAGAVAVLTALFASAAGFALAFGSFPGRRMILAGLILLAALPGQLLLPGGYEVVAALGLLDSRLAVVLPAIAGVMPVLLYRAGFESVPRELLDAARVDGAGEVGGWWHVALPAVAPTTAACLLMSFSASYNAAVWPAVVLQSPEVQTLPVRLLTLSATALTPTDHARLTAATAVGILPVLLLFLLLQREFLPRLGGAVKG